MISNRDNVINAVLSGSILPVTHKIPLDAGTVDNAINLIEGGYQKPYPIQPINRFGQVINPVAYGIEVCDTFDQFSKLGNIVVTDEM